MNFLGPTLQERPMICIEKFDIWLTFRDILAMQGTNKTITSLEIGRFAPAQIWRRLLFSYEVSINEYPYWGEIQSAQKMAGE
jgi:hypothetical protein